MRIEYLADFPELVPVIAKWHHDQWSYMNPARTLSERIHEYEKLHGRKQVPTTVIALQGDRPVGSASLVEHDMDTRMELSPWLASVFVIPQQRGKGIASSLVQKIEKEAGSLGIGMLYLFTPDQESLYARLHWEVLSREEYRGEQVVIMSKKIEVEQRTR